MDKQKMKEMKQKILFTDYIVKPPKKIIQLKNCENTANSRQITKTRLILDLTVSSYNLAPT